MSAASVLTLLVFLVTLAAFAQLRHGMRRLKRLADLPPALDGPAPRVSVILSALNEATTIEPALRSLLALDYSNLEIIAIDDRSTDATGEILERLGLEYPVLRVLHISELPPGWLGKTHALQRGAEVASGHYLLFTDADVVFDRAALRRAVAYCEHEQLDHLVVLAEFVVREHLLAMLLLSGSAFLYASFKPWKVRTSRNHFFGMGAFNMVRASAYRAAGGHRPLALQVVDDIGLGRLMNEAGFRQDVLLGFGSVSLEWYRSTRDMAKGIEKNCFALLGYRFSTLVLLTVALLVVRYWPWVGLFVTQGPAQWMNLASLAIGLATVYDLLRPTKWSRWCLAYWPVVSLVAILMIWRGVILTLLRGGIEWRGTRYPLAELKRRHY